MSSSIPGMLAALAAVFEGTVPAFIAGPVRGQPGDFVAVGWAGPGEVAVESRLDYISADAASGETYNVDVQLVAQWGTGDDLAGCVARVYGYLDVLITAIAADLSMGGACMAAKVAGSALRPDIDETGAHVILTATVTVRTDWA